jgi:hypothetical protein
LPGDGKHRGLKEAIRLTGEVNGEELTLKSLLLPEKK